MSKLLRMFLVFAVMVSCSCTASQDGDFQSFWVEFRRASLAGDLAAIEKMAKMPLEVRGADDSMAVRMCDAKMLAEVFPAILAQTIYRYQGDEVTELSLRVVLEKTPAVAIQEGQNEVRVEQFEFGQVDGRWRLVRAYLEE